MYPGKNIFSRLGLPLTATFNGCFYSTPDKRVKYSDQRVFLSLCVCLSARDYIFGTTRLMFRKFFVHVICGCGPLLLWRHSDMMRDMMRTFGFVDDVISAHKSS